MSCETFPVGMRQEHNPAIQLFGNRLFNDQTPIELLIELLLLVTSTKRIGPGIPFTDPIPTIEMLSSWQVEELQYSPKARLNLKLFAFMGASRLDSRHETHRQHYRELIERLLNSVRVTDSGKKNDVLVTLENLFLGFQGVGANRTWCAQNFLPVCKGFLARETIWNETEARRNDPAEWDDLLVNLNKYFPSNKRLFLARGGEVLYLQLCNALRQNLTDIQRWVRKSGVEIEPKEQDPSWLHNQLQRELSRLLDHCPRTVTDISEFIDSVVEPETADATDMDHQNGGLRYVTAGWCSLDSWQEGYLFAVDLLRICSSELDVIERLQLLETACAVQVLRSLCMQSARHSAMEYEVGWPGYRLAVSAPDGNVTVANRISRHTAKFAEKLIYRAIRSDDIKLPGNELEKAKLLKEADRRYAGKLFISLAKRIGFMIPRRGAGARFTLNEQLLRLLVVTTVPIGGRLTYARFKELVEARHGLVFDSDGLSRAMRWMDGSSKVFVSSEVDSWLQEMLEAAGLLFHLSDSCALVLNPTAKKGVQL